MWRTGFQRSNPVRYRGYPSVQLPNNVSKPESVDRVGDGLGDRFCYPVLFGVHESLQLSLANTLIEVLESASIIVCNYCRHKNRNKRCRLTLITSYVGVVVPLNSINTAKRKHLTKLLQGSYQQGKGHLGDVDRNCKGQGPVLRRSNMWSYRKAKNM